MTNCLESKNLLEMKRPGTNGCRCCCYSVIQLCSLCAPLACGMPGFPVLHYLLEFAETHVHWVSDAILQSQPLLSPSPLVLNLYIFIFQPPFQCFCHCLSLSLNLFIGITAPGGHTSHLFLNNHLPYSMRFIYRNSNLVAHDYAVHLHKVIYASLFSTAWNLVFLERYIRHSLNFSNPIHSLELHKNEMLVIRQTNLYAFAFILSERSSIR